MGAGACGDNVAQVVGVGCGVTTDFAEASQYKTS